MAASPFGSICATSIFGWTIFFPVIVVVFDTRGETAYYMIVQEHFEAHPLTAAQRRRATLTVHIDPGAIVSDTAVRSWRHLKNGDRKARA